jgi:hypothetical protein
MILILTTDSKHFHLGTPIDITWNFSTQMEGSEVLICKFTTTWSYKVFLWSGCKPKLWWCVYIYMSVTCFWHTLDRPAARPQCKIHWRNIAKLGSGTGAPVDVGLSPVNKG